MKSKQLEVIRALFILQNAYLLVNTLHVVRIRL